MIRVLAVCLGCFPLMSASLTGEWAAVIGAGGQEYPLHIELVQDGQKLTGAFGYRADFLWPLLDPRLESGRLSFILRLPVGVEAKFEGTVSDNLATGQLTSQTQGMSGTFSMKKTGPGTVLPALAPRGMARLESLSDEFSSPESLRNWTRFSDAEGWPDRIERADVGATAPGQLNITPKSAAWWAGYHGVYLYKLVSGDFVVTARLKITGKSGGEPANIWTISGLLVRAPGDLKIAREQRKENWIYLMTGRGPAAERVVDAKSTTNGNNAWDITAARAGWYELRIARIGPAFFLFCRPDGGSWTARKTVLRWDLPDVLQVGINVSSDYALSASMPAAKYNAEVFDGKSNIDAATLVDWVRFRPVPNNRDALAALERKSVLSLSDADLLRAFE